MRTEGLRSKLECQPVLTQYRKHHLSISTKRLRCTPESTPALPHRRKHQPLVPTKSNRQAHKHRAILPNGRKRHPHVRSERLRKRVPSGVPSTAALLYRRQNQPPIRPECFRSER